MEYYLVGGTVELSFKGSYLLEPDIDEVLENKHIEPRLICAEDRAQAQALMLDRIVGELGADAGGWLRVDVAPEPADQAMRRLGAPMLPGLANV